MIDHIGFSVGGLCPRQGFLFERAWRRLGFTTLIIGSDGPGGTGHLLPVFGSGWKT